MDDDEKKMLFNEISILRELVSASLTLSLYFILYIRLNNRHILAAPRY